MNIKKQFGEGLVTNNPVLVQQIGMCATMAITTTLFNGVGMGLSVLIILTCCNVVVSAIRKIIPDEIRLAIFVVVIAGFVTIVDLLLQAFVPALSEALGVFIPLIVVNCIILARAEAFASKNGPVEAFCDGIATGIGSKVMENNPLPSGTGVLDQFIGMSGAGSLAIGKNVDAISGATVSSTGVTKGVNAALAVAEALA